MQASAARLAGTNSSGEVGMGVAKNPGAVGVIGLGIMGGAFARNLVADGWRVVGFDTNKARCREASRAGIKIVENAKAVAGDMPTIITSLPHPQALVMTVQGIVDARVPKRV